jgi:hypothetical protein
MLVLERLRQDLIADGEIAARLMEGRALQRE